MTNEEQILRIQKTIGLSRIKFGHHPYFAHITALLESEELKLKSIKSMRIRVLRIIQMAKKYPTYYSRNGQYQCAADCRRTAGDIWRIYCHYFGDIDIFSIMRSLYELGTSDNISINFCNTIHKMTFYEPINGLLFFKVDILGEYGVPVQDWEFIGLDKSQIKKEIK